MHKIRSIFLLLLAANCILAVVLTDSKQCSADQGAVTTLPEVSVSSTVIGSLIKDAPASVSVLRKEDYRERALENIQQIIDYVPDLNWSGGTSRPRFFQIRGVGELEQYEGAPNPSVGFILDDLDLSGLGAGSALFDIDQVEILRGPQSLRFGANALAGVLNLRSADPTEEYEGRAQLSLGTDELHSFGGAVGGPIDGADGKVLFRLSAHRLLSDGFRKDLFLNRDDTNRKDEFTTRFKLRFLPNEWLTLDLMGTWLDFSNGYDTFWINNAFTTQSDNPGRDFQRTAGSVFKLTARLNSSIELKNITGLSKSRNDYDFDGDWGNPIVWDPFNPYNYKSEAFRDRNTFSEELRLSSIDDGYVHGETSRFTGGFFVQQLDENTFTDELSDDVVFDHLDSGYTGKTVALFGQFEQPLEFGLALSAGLRGEVRDMKYDDSRDSIFSPTNRMWGGHITLTKDISESSRVYALISRGFKGGGFNSGPSVPVDNREFTPESLWNYEVGMKSELMNKKLNIYSSVFHLQRRDQQIKFGFQENPDDPLSFLFITDNAAKGSNTGLETEITVLIHPTVQLFAAGALLDSEIKDYTGLGEDLSGRDQAHAPSWQYATGIKITPFDHFYARLDFIGKDDFFFDAVHDQKSKSYALTNLTLSYEFQDWLIQLWGRNLFDTNYAVRGFYFGNEPPDFQNKLYVQRGDPLQVGLTVAYKF